jgi:hypothetical protein
MRLGGYGCSMWGVIDMRTRQSLRGHPAGEIQDRPDIRLTPDTWPIGLRPDRVDSFGLQQA